MNMDFTGMKILTKMEVFLSIDRFGSKTINTFISREHVRNLETSVDMLVNGSSFFSELIQIMTEE